MIAVLIILLATLENIWPIIAGYASTPAGKVFLGTIHHSDDYFYYLSQFTQHTRPWFQTLNLYTAEAVQPTFVGWVNELFGTVFRLLGFSPISAYHVSVLLLTVIVFIAAYKLTRSTLALYLFALFHAFPYFDKTIITYSDYWNNYAVPAVRLGGVPHQLLTAFLSIFLVYLIIQPKKNFVGMIISAFILSSLQPVLWMFISGVTGLSAILYGLLKRMKIRQLGIFCLPAMVVAFGGIIPAFYLSHLFQTPPYTQLKYWESTQNTPYTLLQFIRATGPIFLIALISLPSYLSKLSFSKLFTSLFPIFSILIFLSPVPKLLALTQVRFMSTLTIVCLSIIAAYGISRIKKRILAIAIIGILTLILIPSHIRSIQLGSKFNPSDAFQYLSQSDYAFLQTSAANRDGIFLLIWPYNVVFPGLTGKRSFNGHPLLTINAIDKDTRSQQFFDGSLSESDMKQFLSTYRITYVISYTWDLRLSTLPYLSPIASTPTLALYQFNPL